MKNVALISTGSELVYGSVHESNCYFISNRLFRTGFSVVMHITVGDKIEDIEYAVNRAMRRADIVIMTGGLGPTDDDYTLETLNRIFLLRSTVYLPGKKNMEQFFASIGREVMENDLKQVTVPEGAQVFDNEVGLAAGYHIRVGGKSIVAMPGVPAEMEAMFENKVLPFLLNEYKITGRKYTTIRTILMREAQVNDLIKQMEIDLGRLEWGITTVLGMNTVTFVGKEDDYFPEERIIAEAKRLFGEKMISPESASLEEELVALLRRKKLTMSVAESCTGGLIQKRITDIPGASEVFPGGVVTYSDQSKEDLVAVSAATLSRFGAVSAETAREMALGVRARFGSHIGLSVTGIAGPSGGSAEKPVGTVYIGLAAAAGAETVKIELRVSDRHRIRLFSSQHAMDFARIYLSRL